MLKGSPSLASRGSPRLVWALLFLLVATPRVHSCQYNVRDLGFFDAGASPYILYVIIQDGASSDASSRLQESCAAALRDSNITLEMVPRARAKDHPVLGSLAAAGGAAGSDRAAGSNKAAGSSDGATGGIALEGVLVSPDGQALPVPPAGPGGSEAQRLSEQLRSLVASPSRDEILRCVARAFGVILLVEGPDPSENRRAREAASAAVGQIGSRLKTYAKPLAEPPALLVVERAALERERVLLWSLGLEPGGVEQVRAALIYGRARWIGPLMRGEEITEGNLSGIFSIVGADCECGLDLAWTQGTRLPVVWSAQTHAECVKSLGFDPESPLVQAEMERIVSRQTRDRPMAPRGAETRPEEHALARPDMSPPAGKTWSEPPPEARKETSPLRRVLPALALVGALAVAAAAWILVRAARRR